MESLFLPSRSFQVIRPWSSVSAADMYRYLVASA